MFSESQVWKGPVRSPIRVSQRGSSCLVFSGGDTVLCCEELAYSVQGTQCHSTWALTARNVFWSLSQSTSPSPDSPFPNTEDDALVQFLFLQVEKQAQKRTLAGGRLSGDVDAGVLTHPVPCALGHAVAQEGPASWAAPQPAFIGTYIFGL